MGASFKEFALRNVFWLANAFWVLVSSCVVRILWILFAKISGDSKERSQISGVGADEVRENPDDRNGATGEIFRFDSGFESICEEENSNCFDSLSASNGIASKYEFLTGNSFCGYIEQPRNTNFKVQELFLDAAFEEGITGDSVIADHSVFQELEYERKTGDSVAQEVDEQCKTQGCLCSEPYLDEDFREVNDQAKEEVCVCSEPSLDKDFGEVDDQVETKVPDTREPSVGKDSEDVIDVVKMDVFVCNEFSSIEDDRQLDDKGETNSSFSVSSDEGVKSDILNLSQEELLEQRESSNEFSANSQISCEAALEELISLDPDELSEKADIVALSIEFHLWDNQLAAASDYVNQEPSRPSNDFWHTNGKFIADFHEDCCYHSAAEVLAPKTPMCHDTKSVHLLQEDVSGSDSTDSDDDDHKDSVMNHTDADEEYWDKSDKLEMEGKSNQVSEEDDEMDLDALLANQSLVQKMKKEMKHSRNIGLPTILEESESPRMDEDLKPLRINEKMGYKDRLDEIQRFYKSYLDKMRRLDILCHQTMYAVGFLQLKNQFQLSANRKLSLPSVKSLFAHNFRLGKFRRHESDPVQKLLRDLHRDLELVYVGQLCLSWEILKWQHAKAEELQLFDTMGARQYSLVAGEFQQFQVLMQRFTEDEPFQCPRVEHYVKNRCDNCNILQVPPIKDDSNNLGRNGEGRAVISIVRLTDIIEESMHAFWEFIRADKKEPGNVGHHDPSDTELLSDIRSNLAKKERRLKDLVRSGNCIAKKFQKRQACRLSHELLLAQVEFRLVSRVIGMSRLTADQLQWCHKKLSKINIVGRKVDVESSFSLFPC